MTESPQFVCNMNAMTGEERARYDVLRGKLEQAVERVEELENGYTFRLRDGSISLEEVAQWVEYEQKCCPFFGLGVEAAPQKGPIALRATGEPGVKDFIRMEFAGIRFE
jgi:hypothetical protein